MVPKKTVSIDLDDLEIPVAPIHPAYWRAEVGRDGALRVRTSLHAGRGNITQAYPGDPVDPGVPIVAPV
jgi:hypothetical protein